MAKMFYTLDETKSALGQTEDQIKALTREGRLREFRDGPRLMFKADQVDALKSSIGAALDDTGSGAPVIGLADTSSGSGSGGGIPLAEHESGSGLAGISGSGLGSGLAGGHGGLGSGMMNLKEDTALAADLGLSGTVGGIPSPGRTGAGSGLGSLSGTAHGSHAGSLSGSHPGGSMGGSMGGSVGGSMAGSMGSRQGINVFGDDTHMPADPMAQTAMPSAASMADLNLEGIGSGSGLLDLTRESDETSLGAELLDEISPPTGRGAPARPLGPPDTGSMDGVRLDAPRGGIVRGTMGVQQVEAYDGWSLAFGSFALGGAIVTMLGLFVLLSGSMGFQPEQLHGLSEKDSNAFALVFGVGLVICVLALAFGKLISASMRR